MSEGILQSFNINELAGATGLILGAVSGILVVIFKSRCYCKFRVGFTDNCNICMCERKPPPDVADIGSDDEEKVKDKDKKDKVGRTKDDKQTPSQLLDRTQTDESIIPQSSKDSNITATISEP